MKHSKFMTALFALICAAGAARWWGQHLPSAAEPRSAETSSGSGPHGARAPGGEQALLPVAPRSSALASSSPPSQPARLAAAGAADPVAAEDAPAADLPSAEAPGAPADSRSLDVLAEALPEVRVELHRYQRAVARARAGVDDYQRRMRALERSRLEGQPSQDEERALEERRDELLAQAQGLGRQAMQLNEAIRSAAEVSLD